MSEITSEQLQEVIERAENNTMTDGQVVLTTSAQPPDGCNIEGVEVASHPIDGEIRTYSLGEVRAMLHHLSKKETKDEKKSTSKGKSDAG